MIKIHPYYFSSTKRVFDLLLALLLSIVLLPMLVIIALIILITTGQPIIFKQKRTGQNGKTFTIYKFRTMEKNAALTKHKYENLNQAPAPMFKIHDDPRFVGLGRFLSRTGFDELPQLLNIIEGNMSFVGPRPLPIKEAEALPKKWKAFREQVKPGIFSEWSISWERHQSLAKWQKLEEQTMKNGSIYKDFFYIYEVISSQLLLLLKKKKLKTKN
ncbi:MAG: sugar transferase [Patescibacteria group bacterium]